MTIAVVLLLAVMGGLFARAATADEHRAPVNVAIHSVAAGETLWHIAAQVTPAGGDVRDTIDDVLELNALASVDLVVGQQLLVPQQ